MNRPHVSLCIKCQFYEEDTGYCYQENSIDFSKVAPDVLTNCKDFLVKEAHVFFGGKNER